MTTGETHLDPLTRKIFKTIAYVTTFVILSTTLYGVVATVIQGAEVVGETLVTIEFPPITVFPLFYSKPITWLAASIIAFWFTALELNKPKVARIDRRKRHFLRFFAFFVAAMALYEVMFNFTLWSGLIAAHEIRGQLNPDIIRNPFPNPQTPWNIVFATKLFTVLTIISVYAFFFLQRVEREEEERDRLSRT